MPQKNPAEEAIVQVLTRRSPEQMSTRDVRNAVQETRAIELARCWELLWALYDRGLIKTYNYDGRRWSI